ncbi:MAG: c-type cytochrome [Mariprofundaceae bacterium]
MHHRLTIVLLAMLNATLLACGQNEEKSSGGFVSSSLENLARDTLPGAKLTKRKCASCHYLDRNLTKVGPTLNGIFGRAPKISGVPFKIWNELALDQWIESPSRVKPGTRMAIPGIKSVEERTAIIEYLKQL